MVNISDFHKKRNEKWKEDLEYSIDEKTKKRKSLKKNSRNIEKILEHTIFPCLAYDKFAMEATLINKLPWREIDDGEEWQSYDYNQLEHWFATKWDITGKDKIYNAFIHGTHKRGFHPIKNFIESVKWDGVIRVPTFFCDYLGSEHGKYTWEVTKRWFTGAVKRIYEPGCKFEIVPVLIGEKGMGKSEVGRRLANNKWFTDSLKSIDPKIAGEILAKVWICEFNELTTFSRKSNEDTKAFISSQEDTYRGAYERGNATKHKRHTAFYGTSNNNDVVKDKDERRQFPIKCNKNNRKFDPYIVLTPEVVAQIWAEAKVYYDEDYFTYIDEEIQELAEQIYKNHREEDPLTGEINEYVKNHGVACVREIWDEIVSDGKKPTRKDSNRIVDILTSLGYEKVGQKRFAKYGKQTLYGIKND
jgi:predicted P-loop ATPase